MADLNEAFKSSLPSGAFIGWQVRIENINVVYLFQSQNEHDAFIARQLKASQGLPEDAVLVDALLKYPGVQEPLVLASMGFYATRSDLKQAL